MPASLEDMNSELLMLARRAVEAEAAGGDPMQAIGHPPEGPAPDTAKRAILTLLRELVRIADKAGAAPAPIPMLLWCPGCLARHVDRGVFETKPHHTHSCQSCGMTWRPAVVATVGVQFLPGFKDPPPRSAEGM